jgi:hypothetical protein
MNLNIELIKKNLCHIIWVERDILGNRYDLYIEDVEQLITKQDIYIWINNYRYIFSKYGKEDIDKITLKLKKITI